MSRICTKCHKEYPATTEYFYARKDSKDGLRNTCRSCDNKVKNRYWATEKGKLTAKRYGETKAGKVTSKRKLERYRSTIKGTLRNTFAHMKERCDNPNHSKYRYYGGRGIKNKFTSNEFVEYVINILEIDPRGLDVDRIDNNGNYEPGNIQFITHKENLRKKVPQ